MEKIRLEKRVGIWLGILLYTTLFLELAESVLPVKTGIFKLTFIAALVLSMISIALLRSQWKDMIRQVREKVCMVKSITLFLSGYIVFDIIGLFYTKDMSHALLKYVVVGQMALFCMMYLLYMIISCKDGRRCANELLLVFMVTGASVSVAAYINYFTGVFSREYYLRISPIRDYNQFATMVLLGVISAGCLFARDYFGPRFRFLILGGTYVLCGTATYLSASRRGYLILLVYSLFLIVFVYYKECWKKRKEHPAVRLFGSVTWKIVLCVGLCFFISAYMTKSFDTAYDKRDNDVIESDISEDIQSITTGKAMNKRKVIWGMAVKELKTYRIPEIFIGKGSSYNTDFYDEGGKVELLEAYGIKEAPNLHWMSPHNFLLSDLLTGGLLKGSLSLGLLLCVIWRLLRRIIQGETQYIFIGALIGICYMNAFISLQFGYIGDKNYWVCLLILCVESQICADKRLKNEVVE